MNDPGGGGSGGQKNDRAEGKPKGEVVNLKGTKAGFLMNPHNQKNPLSQSGTGHLETDRQKQKKGSGYETTKGKK